MSKYYLIASHYNINTKSYQNQTEVKLENIDLSTIQAIDNFTASYNKTDILNRINQEMNLEEMNHLAIKIINGNDCSPDYCSIIERNPDFALIKNETKSVKFYKNNKIKVSYIISPIQSSTYINNQYQKLLNIINQGDLNQFIKFYHPRNDDELYGLVARYINNYSKDENELTEEEKNEKKYILTAIKNEFLNYMTFRKWIIEEQKRQNRYIRRPNRQQQIQQPVITRKKNTPPYKTIEEIEEEYIKDFEKNNDISWKKAQIINHNLSYIEEDKEEYLEENEYEMMYETFEQTEQLHTPTPKRRRR